MGKYAKQMTPLKFAASKVTTEAFLSVAGLGIHSHGSWHFRCFEQ
jgi:hypothetical protein